MSKFYLGNPTNTLAVINRYEFAFQKKFGQNFLIDQGIVEKIVREAGVTKDDFVLEVGPGIGTMTQILCENAREVAAVEIDRKLIPILNDTLSEYDNVLHRPKFKFPDASIRVLLDAIKTYGVFTKQRP